MTHFERNAARLGAPLRKRLEAAGEPNAELEILNTEDTEPTARYAGRYLHARREPAQRPRRTFTEDWVREHPFVVFFGFGLGYEVEAFLEQPDAETAIVVEPDAGLFRAALEQRDLTAVLDSPKAVFLVDAEPDALAMILRRHERRVPERAVLNASVLHHRAYFDRVDAVMEAAASRARINANTLKRFGRLWVRNLIRNVAVLERSPGVHDLSDRFTGMPVLLCAAGPSLDLVLPRIGELAERLLIVAVDTALPALVQHGVEPDFAVVVDPQYWNTRHLDRLAPRSTILISEASAHPRVFEVLDNPTYLCSSIFPLGSLLEEVAGEKGKLGTGGSVSTTAWDFARMLGGNPIYCVGLDLGFPHRQTHVHGSFFEERSHMLARRLHPAEQHSFEYLNDAEPFEVPANDGGTVLTDRRMMIYTWWFANQARIHTDVRTFNLSPGGVAIDGLPPADVEDLSALPVAREDLEQRLRPLRTAPGPAEGSPEGGPLRATVLDLADRLEEFAGTAREGRDMVLHLCEQSRPDVSRLDAVDARLASFPYKDVAGFLMQEVADHVIESARDRSVAGALESARTLYEGLTEAAEYHVRLLRLAPRLPHYA
ncbi:MAG: motility associated factor glycosyltransferase family protein [Spirochaetaceae bacterium]